MPSRCFIAVAFLVTSAGARLYRNLGQLVFEESSEVHFRRPSDAPVGATFAPVLPGLNEGPTTGARETDPVEGLQDPSANRGRVRASVSRPTSGPPSIPPWVAAEHVHFEEPSVSERDVAPEFSLQTPEGDRTITLSGLRGKPVILVFGSFT